MRILLLVLAITYSTDALSCFSPIGGDKYDSQIKIEKLTKNHYRVTVPSYMENMPHKAKIILAYSSHSPSGIPVNEKNQVLEPVIQGSKSIAEFVVKKQEKRPYLVIMWWPSQPGMCGIQANSGFLEVD